MHLNLHLLRIFARVAEARSFSRAAQSLHISQPAVSKAVRELERQLDLPLLERGAGGGRGVRLTENGRALFEHARGIFALEHAALEDLRARLGQQRGKLAVGASTTVAGYWLPPHLATLAKELPGIDVRVVVGNTRQVVQALLDCEVDLALVEGAVDDPRIVATHWRDDPLAVIASPEHAFARRRKFRPGELDDQTWLLREPGSGTRRVAEAMMQSLGISPRRIVELGSNEGIARSVAAGLGVAILPDCVVHELVELGQLRRLRLPTPARGRPLFQLRLRERPESPLVRAFGALLERH